MQSNRSHRPSRQGAAGEFGASPFIRFDECNAAADQGVPLGKARIQAMLARKGCRLSVSTVGRITERAFQAGAIRRAAFCGVRVKPKRRRRFAEWARRWECGAKARKSGELVQVDR